MAADLILALARCNAVASVAVLIVLMLREPLRRWLGAGCAYAVWLVVPLGAAGSLMPPALASGAPGAVEATNSQLLTWLTVADHARALLWIWLIGALAACATTVWRHRSFSAAVRAGLAGPAAVGVFRPRLVLPADFTERFTEEERRLVYAHERTHMERLDGRYNAAAALAMWVCWFNPLLHLAVRAMRLDQELACDAAVLDRLPRARRLYAETLLRTHQGAAAPILGREWRSRGARALEARIRLLGQAPPSQARLEFGLVILLATWTFAFGAAWAAQPPARAPESPATVQMILVELTPPSARDAKREAAIYRMVEGMGVSRSVTPSARGARSP
jgi:beta-lactamase regulating signal transducer with metallopeptidase domain